MKHAKAKFVTAAVVLLTSGLSFAAPFSIDELQNATKVATEDFKVNNQAHVQHFTGFKSWQSGENAKVKIYVNHGGMAMEFNYTCERGGEAIISCSID